MTKKKKKFNQNYSINYQGTSTGRVSDILIGLNLTYITSVVIFKLISGGSLSNM
jgi:hypothetical protein